METLRENAELREVLGEAVRPEPVWWLNGDPYIHGAVSLTFGSFDSSLPLHLPVHPSSLGERSDVASGISYCLMVLILNVVRY